MLILDENEAYGHLKKLSKAGGDMTRYCGTKNQLIGYLNGDVWTKFFSPDLTVHIHQTIKCWKEYYALFEIRDLTKCYGHEFTGTKEISVHVDLRMALGNTIERSIFNYIKTLEREQKARSRKPGRWEYLGA